MSAPPKKPGMSLYGHLLHPDSATISSAPVKYDTKTNGGEETQKKKDGTV